LLTILPQAGIYEKEQMKNKPIIPNFDDPQWWWSGMPYVALRDIKDEYADKDALLNELKEENKCKCKEPKKLVESESEKIICVKCYKPV